MGRNEDRISIEVARGGWVRVRGLSLPVDLYVRYFYNTYAADRLQAVQVVVKINDADSGIDVAAWRGIPIARLETIVNQPDVKPLIVNRMLDIEADVEIGVSSEEFEPVLRTTYTRRTYHLPAPKARNYGDAFYQKVAEAYHAAVLLDDPPAMAIAEANGVPATTVRRWFAEARRRGLLGPAQSMGRVG
jgi:hypothetical protein